MNRSSILAIALAFVACASPPHGATSSSGAAVSRQMERLGRGLVAVPTGRNHVFVSWRLLGTDPDGVGFNLYRIVGSAEPVSIARVKTPRGASTRRPSSRRRAPPTRSTSARPSRTWCAPS